MKAVQDDIAKHYVESISDFLGRKITIQEVIEAIKTGWI
jgi:lipoate-protein ligase A